MSQKFLEMLSSLEESNEVKIPQPDAAARRHSQSAQASFEALMVTAIVFAITFGILTIAIEEKNITTAAVIVKTSALEKIAQFEEQIIIKKIETKANDNSICLNVITEPSALPSAPIIDWTETLNKIKTETSFTIVEIKTNQAC